MKSTIAVLVVAAVFVAGMVVTGNQDHIIPLLVGLMVFAVVSKAFGWLR